MGVNISSSLFRPYPFINNPIIWFSKNLILSIIFMVIFLKYYDQIDNSNKNINKKDQIKVNIFIIILLSLITFIFMHIGHNGGPLCGISCHDTTGIIYAITPIIIAVFYFILIVNFKIIQTFGHSRIILIILTLISLIIIIISLFHSYYVINLNKDQKLFSKSEVPFGYFSLADHVREKAIGYSKNEWFSICKKYRLTSLYFDFLGHEYADQCYYTGALHYEDEKYCEYSYERKEICMRDYNTLKNPDKLDFFINLFGIELINNIDYVVTLDFKKTNYAEFNSNDIEIYIDDFKIGNLPIIQLNDLNYLKVTFNIKESIIDEFLKTKENEEIENYHQATLFLKYRGENVGSKIILSCDISNCPLTDELPRYCPWTC